MKQSYIKGGFGYGHAKNELLNFTLKHFREERNRFQHFSQNTQEIDIILKLGAQKASIVANEVLSRVRKKISYV